MTPPEATARHAPTRTEARVAGGRASGQPASAPARRVEQPDLRVVEPRVKRSRQRSRRIGTGWVCGAMLFVSLMTVVVGHSLLAQGQVRLSTISSQASTLQAQERDEELTVARLETPSRIVARAEQLYHMGASTNVAQVPSVSLTTPLGPPKIEAAG